MFRIAIIALLMSSSLHAEAFGNSSFVVPKLGITWFDAPMLLHKKRWGLAPHYTIGSSFMQAINYRWWWVVETQVGLGKIIVPGKPYVGSFSGGAGVRFNIFEGDFRPHWGLLIHYLQFLGENTNMIPLDVGTPIFVGLKPFFGMEWLMYSEMSLSFDASIAVYVNLNEPFRRVVHAGLSYAFYF